MSTISFGGSQGREPMQDALTIYFDGEKYAGLLLAGIGVAIIAAVVFIFRAGADLRTFAVTLTVLALAKIALGVGLYLRTRPQVSRLVAQLDSDATRFHADESTRMKRVQRNFVAIELIELSIISASALAAVMLRGRSGVTGIMLGLLIHAALLLAFDLLAGRRGAAYLAAIEERHGQSQ